MRIGGFTFGILLPMQILLLLINSFSPILQAQLIGKVDVLGLKKEANKKKDVVTEVKVDCNAANISVKIITSLPVFNGMVYPKGLSKNSSCMSEYIDVTGGIIQYQIPLRSCNTMNTDVENGIEYFNTIVVQPHRKLVTNHGKGYHVRCQYQTIEKTLLSDFNVRFDWAADSQNKFSHGDASGSVSSLSATAAMPSSSMRIFFGDPINGNVAESVKIGDPLTLVVSIEEQNIYGMFISNCFVEDGLKWSKQKLIMSNGCAADNEIMTDFEYSNSKTSALVHFQAHKFPYTSSVYYQCNVRLCIKHAGGCQEVPPVCDGSSRSGISDINSPLRRQKRQTIELDGEYPYDPSKEDVDIKVYSGLYVNEANNLDETDDPNDIAQQISSKTSDPSQICFPQRKFAVGIAVSGLVLMLIVIITVLCLLSRRRKSRKNLSTNGSSSIYSGPYTNTAFSHTST